MIIKISYLDNGLFQIDGQETPIEESSLVALAKIHGMDDVKAMTWIEEVKQLHRGQLEKTAQTGVIVDLYEVDYPPPANPLKETEDLASHLNEQKDFVTQYLFPGTTVPDVIVGLRSQVLKPSHTSSRGWRRALAFEPGDIVSRDQVTKKQWGGGGRGYVRPGDVLPSGDEKDGKHYRFIAPISYRQMVVESVYGDSYHATNSGYDVIQFLGYSDIDVEYGEGGVRFQTIQEVFKQFDVRGLSALAAKTSQIAKEKYGEDAYGHDVYMWARDVDSGEEGGWYYIFEGRWCRGSGAEALSFWQVEEVYVQ